MTRSDGGAPPAPWGDAARTLDAIAGASLRRQLLHGDNAPAAWLGRDGRRWLNFSSNNYLDLAAHPRVTAAAAAAATRFGAGSGGSRLITGSLLPHRELEDALAAFKGAEAALVFSSGYLANLGVLQALARRSDGSRVAVFFDRLSHACVVDGAQLSGAPWRTFPHNDLARLGQHLARAAAGGKSPAAIVVTEGVFSMDGDLAPLAEMMSLCERHDALLVVDDAHGTGTIGPGGRGAAALAGICGPRVIHMGTLSKALGSQGGFIAGPAVLRDLLVNRARAFIFDTALAPPSAAAALEAVHVIVEEPERIGALARRSALLRVRLREHGFTVPESPSPVVPVILGDAERTLRASAELRDRGFLVVAIRPPTVPRGTSRLRITVMASHTDEQVAALADAVAAAAA